MAKTRPERDDALQFTSNWIRGEKRYQLALAYPVIKFPDAALPPGLKWDLWYDKPYLMVLASVLSGQRWLNRISFGKKFAPQIEGLAPVVSADGKKGWYQFFEITRGLTYRVQFFPESKSSRCEIEFHYHETSLKAETYGGAMPLESFPDPAFLFRRAFVLHPSREQLKIQTVEHQNRMFWEAEKVTVINLAKIIPSDFVLGATAPEMSYVGKGSRFAKSYPKKIAAEKK